MDEGFGGVLEFYLCNQLLLSSSRQAFASEEALKDVEALQLVEV